MVLVIMMCTLVPATSTLQLIPLSMKLVVEFDIRVVVSSFTPHSLVHLTDEVVVFERKRRLPAFWTRTCAEGHIQRQDVNHSAHSVKSVWVKSSLRKLINMMGIQKSVQDLLMPHVTIQGQRGWLSATLYCLPHSQSSENEEWSITD